MSVSDKRLPQEEINWIRGLRQAGENWDAIALKWECGTGTLYKRLRVSGIEPARIGIPKGLPVLSMSDVSKDPSLVVGPNAVTTRKGSDMVIMPMAEYIRLSGLSCG